MAKIINGLNVPYKTTFGVGDLVLIRDTDGNLSQVTMVVTTNPDNTPLTTTTTSPTSTDSTSTSTTTSTTTDGNIYPTTTSTSTTSSTTKNVTGQESDEGNVSGGNYPNEDTADDSNVSYTLVDLATGTALVTQTLSLAGLLKAVEDTYANFNILDANKASLTLSMNDSNSAGITNDTAKDKEYTVDTETVSI